jgi:hypothetical protein
MLLRRVPRGRTTGGLLGGEGRKHPAASASFHCSVRELPMSPKTAFLVTGEKVDSRFCRQAIKVARQRLLVSLDVAALHSGLELASSWMPLKASNLAWATV